MIRLARGTVEIKHFLCGKCFLFAKEEDVCLVVEIQVPRHFYYTAMVWLRFYGVKYNLFDRNNNHYMDTTHTIRAYTDDLERLKEGLIWLKREFKEEFLIIGVDS